MKSETFSNAEILLKSREYLKTEKKETLDVRKNCH